MSVEGLRIATYEFLPQHASADAPVVVALHGFASSAYGNWVATGWTRDLTRAGFRVIAIDQRGHGASDKPHDVSAYSMHALVGDLVTVLDTYLLDEVRLVGYSLGARVGWHACVDLPHRIERAVLGGIPDGDPLTRFRVDAARGFVRRGAQVGDRLTEAYLDMASQLDNDLDALIDLVAGMRGGPQPDPRHPPQQPVLFATGAEDSILPKSRALAAACPHGSFVELPRRNHFNAPISREFREAGIEFLRG